MMQKLLPASILDTLADAIELDALTHALDLRMAKPWKGLFSVARHWIKPYCTRLSPGWISAPADASNRFTGWGGKGAQAVRLSGVATSLRLARGPARATGLGDLHGFWARGFAVFSMPCNGSTFLSKIETEECASARGLFAGKPDPFRLEAPRKPAAKPVTVKRVTVRKNVR